jgi:hypothetical protein
MPDVERMVSLLLFFKLKNKLVVAVEHVDLGRTPITYDR